MRELKYESKSNGAILVFYVEKIVSWNLKKKKRNFWNNKKEKFIYLYRHLMDVYI